MNSHARVVIVGGGIMGAGLAYHLALEGWTDIALLEKGELTSGSTWHAAGQCPHFNGSLNLTKVHVYGTQLYPKLEALTGQAVSWHPCGGLRLALTDDEVDWFKHVHGISRLADYDCEIIGPSQIRQYHPFLETFGVMAAFRTLHDGHVAPADVTNAMAAGARKLGAAIHRRTRVCDIKRLASGEWRVATDKGDITCEHVVNAAGSYCDVVASWTGHIAPIANMLHHYVITEPLKELVDFAPELPVVRDPYSHAYLREETDGVLVGPYETATAHLCWGGEPPRWDFESELVPPELDRLTPWLEKAAERLPLFGRAGLRAIVSGAITHTPDGVYLSGPAPGPKNYWMHCGASIGICQGAGAGKYLAQLMAHGRADINMREFDPRRFGNWATKDYTEQVSVADYHHMYYCYKPGEQHEVGSQSAKILPAHRAREKGRAVFAGLRLGTSSLVCARRGKGSLFIPPLELVGGGARGSACGTRARGSDGFVELRQIRSQGQGRAGFPRPHLRQQTPRTRRRHCSQPSARRARLDPIRDDDHAVSRGAFLPRLGRRCRASRSRPDALAQARERGGGDRERHGRLRHARACGAPGKRGAFPMHEG